MGQGASTGGGGGSKDRSEYTSSQMGEGRLSLKTQRTQAVEVRESTNSNGDASIFLGSPPAASPQAPTQPQPAAVTRRASNAQDAKRSKLVPTVFRWAHGGQNVYITGTFNNWRERIPLNRSHEEFATILDLEPGTTHHYKFIVDDEWKYNFDYPTVADRAGAINNFLEVCEVDDVFDFEDFASSSSLLSPPGSYGREIPKLDSSVKAPPVLPPHLQQILLNSDPVSDTDPSLLPIPNHVMLNHLYALSISDGTMVLGATTRYDSKYVTTILYRPVDIIEG
eukprot:comp13482_c0_seq1/m.9022 comp13482_c0_seq1/g.9022  ORF comp13482_c0_seq1/g.9022 comp13482_c0_seq1/m.9022 type:complete len:281 (-) comp13482_c0_seq1:157-999(-)